MADKLFSPVLSNEYQEKLKDKAIFEIRSLVGDLLFNSPPNYSNSKRFLHLGCGTIYLEGWVNADFYDGLLPWNKNKVKIDWMQDFRKGLNCKDNYWQGVFSEHTLEHFYPWEALSLLKEVHRTMEKNAWLRIVVPDLALYIKFYISKKDKRFRKEWKLGSEAIWSIAQYWGHKSIWDSELLAHFLLEAGFRNVKKAAFGRGTDRRIIKDQLERRWESLYIEAQK